MSEEKSKKGKSNLLLVSAILILTITLVAVGGLSFYVLTQGKDKGQDGEKVEVSVEDIAKQSVQTETITTSLYSGNFVVLQLNALLDSEDGKLEFEAKQAQVKSIIISYLSEKNASDLKGKENLDKVLAELQTEINSKLHEGKIIELFIVDYKLQ